MDDYVIPQFPIKRLRYFNNQFLNQQDFIDDQAAHLGHERAHLRALCVAGVCEGFALTFPVSAAATVGQGIAIDKDGQLIVIKDTAAGPVPSGLAQGAYLLHIRFNEVAADQATGQGAQDNKHWLSQPLIGATLASAGPPTGAVVLGSFTVAADHTVSNGSAAGRQFSGLRLPGPGTGNATLRSDGVLRGSASEGALLTGLLTVRRDVTNAIGASLTLTNGVPFPGTNATSAVIDLNACDPGTNDPAVRIQSLGDGSQSSHLVFYTKPPNAVTNALVERLRITSGGVTQVSGALTTQSLSVASITGDVAFTGAVTMGSTLSVTGLVTARTVQVSNESVNETTPLVVHRVSGGKVRSVVDAAGYRMGRVSEIDENWKLGSTRSQFYAMSPADFGGGALPSSGTGNIGTGIRMATAAAQADMQLRLPAGTTIESAKVFYKRTDGSVQYALIDKGNTGTGAVTLTSTTVNTGTTATSVSLGGVAGTGLPFTFNDLSYITLNVSGISGLTVGHEVYGVQLTCTQDPPGWIFNPGSNSQLQQVKRQYGLFWATSSINHRGVFFFNSINASGPATGTLTTEGYEVQMDNNISYVQEWVCSHQSLNNNRYMAMGVQNANGGANNRFIYFFNQNTTANWQLRIVGSTTVDTDTGVVCGGASVYRMRLEIRGPGPGGGPFRILAFIDGVKVVEVTTSTLPTPEGIRPYFEYGTTSTLLSTSQMWIGRVRRCFSHMQVTDAF